jgi:hypothetical protein
MRRTLGALLLTTLLLAGCGDDTDGGRADDPASPSTTTQSPSRSPSQSPTEEPSLPDGQSGDGWRLVEIVHATDVDGRVSTTPTPVRNRAEVEEFSAQFTRPQMQEEILRVVEQHQPAEGTELVAAVIAIGCDVPPGVTYVDGEIRALKVRTSGVQCMAAVTSVAILEVEA